MKNKFKNHWNKSKYIIFSVTDDIWWKRMTTCTNRAMANSNCARVPNTFAAKKAFEAPEKKFFRRYKS